jgi:hypothetical protein
MIQTFMELLFKDLRGFVGNAGDVTCILNALLPAARDDGLSFLQGNQILRWARSLVAACQISFESI